ncbi:MAG: Gfo/Idh/MocA family oxidoreductase [Planctomycetaceae bacterium]|nr:Gfo/Idh/MocA family oxidoreductase [Planctomycetales bacterium]MCB9924623.1 Gfo/Idh/MocA family oxidoreductase [Planctomycetaceae bacterium]
MVCGGYHLSGAEHQRIKVGQIGTKHAHASGKMDTLRKFSDLYEVVGVVEPDEQRWQQLKDTNTYRDLKRMSETELLNVSGLQAVAVETEVRELLCVAERCVAAGMHIHLDKPAGESLSHFKRVLDDATRQQLVVQMGYMFRYNPAFQLAFRAAREGWFGHVFEVHAVMSKLIGTESRRELAAYAGGSMFELGCHVIDAVVKVLGRPTDITAFNRKTFAKQDSLLDNCLAVLEYPSATATVRSSVVEYDGGRRRQFVVCGDRGSIDIKPLEAPRAVLAIDETHGTYAKGTREVTLTPLGGRYDGDFLDLAKIIRGEKQHDFPPEHDLAVQEVVLKASDLPID